MTQSVFSIAPAWSCNSSLYQHSMTYTGVIQIMQVESSDAADMVGAFVGTECRGVAKPVYVSALNRYLVFMVVYSNVASGENISFKIYKANQDYIYTIAQPKNFVSFASEGNVDNPYIWSYKTPSTKANIQAYSFSQQSEPAVIDSVNHTIVIKVNNGTSLNALTAAFTLSAGATAKVGNSIQMSNTTVNNFANPLVYTITAEDNINSTNWTVYVSEAVLIKNYDILIQKNEGGTIKENNVSLLDGTVVTAIEGTSKTFTITVNAGYEIATLTYNGADVKSQITNNQYTTPSVSGNATLIIRFKKIQYQLSLKDASTGTINLLCDYGATPSFNFSPSTNWKVNAIFFNDIDVTNSLIDGVYTVPAIVNNALLNVSFVNIVTGAPEIINNHIKVYNTQSEIIVEGTKKGEIVTLYSSNGKQIHSIKSEDQQIRIQVVKDNMYLLKTQFKTFKVIL